MVLKTLPTVFPTMRDSGGSDSDSSSELEYMDYEHDWEPEVPLSTPTPEPKQEEEEEGDAAAHHRRANTQQNLNCGVHVEHFNDTCGHRAGEPVQDPDVVSSQEKYKSYFANTNIYAPFTSELDWKVSQWAKLHGPGSTAFSELLSIPGVHTCFTSGFKIANYIDKSVNALDSHLVH